MSRVEYDLNVDVKISEIELLRQGKIELLLFSMRDNIVGSLSYR